MLKALLLICLTEFYDLAMAVWSRMLSISTGWNVHVMSIIIDAKRLDSYSTADRYAVFIGQGPL